MTIIESIILGIVQGLTEFLPVSSSGHLVLLQQLWHINEPGISFEVIVHLGSLLAVIIFFHKDIASLLVSFTKIFNKNKSYHDINNLKVIFYLVTATIATACLGFIFKDTLKAFYDMPLVVSIALAVTGLIIFISDKLGNGRFDDHNIGWVKAIFIGIGQALAIIPGISRSGTTIAFALFSKMKRENAARFSFLLSIPAILGAAVLDFSDIEPLSFGTIVKYSMGAISAFISGFLVIALLMTLIKNKKLKYFSYYLWLLSLISILIIVL